MEAGCYTTSDGPYIGLISEQNDIVYSKQNTYLWQRHMNKCRLIFYSIQCVINLASELSRCRNDARA